MLTATREQAEYIFVDQPLCQAPLQPPVPQSPDQDLVEVEEEVDD